MRRTLLPAVLVATSTLFLAGCFSGQGIRVGTDGSLKPNTAKVVATDTAEHIRESLEEGLGKGWKVEVAYLPELPTYEVVEADEFGWGSLTATIVCRSDGTTPTKDTPDAVSEAVRGYLKHKVRRPAERNLVVITRFEISSTPAATAPATTPVPGSPVASATPAAGNRSYTVQQGDTWADISTAFYGAPEHWRVIRDANPQVGGSLQAGTVVTIPMRP